MLSLRPATRVLLRSAAPSLSTATATTLRTATRIGLSPVATPSFTTSNFTSRLYSTEGSKLSREEVTKRVSSVLKAFNKDNSATTEITDSTSFQKDLGLDSLDTVELLVAIEEEFDIEMPDKVADELKTVGETIQYIVSNPEAN